jgi:probable phosphomutase (TIGR03848 family)
VTTVVLLRHGRTKSNATGVLAGRSSGVELDETGRGQVVRAAERLAGVSLAGIVSSPLQRCRQTAGALLDKRPDRHVEIDRGLIECGYGDWTGRKLSELAKEPLWRTVQTQPSAVQFPGGEAMVEMSSRALHTIHTWDKKIAADHGDHAVWVAVSHGDVIKAILAAALGMHLDAFQRILVDPASLSVVRLSPDRPYVLTMNSTAGDLTSMLTAPKKSGRRGARRSATKATDAPVGGGTGAGGMGSAG